MICDNCNKKDGYIITNEKVIGKGMVKRFVTKILCIDCYKEKSKKEQKRWRKTGYATM